jgi:hypothetical protein
VLIERARRRFEQEENRHKKDSRAYSLQPAWTANGFGHVELVLGLSMSCCLPASVPWIKN